MVPPGFTSYAVGAPTAVGQMRAVMDPYLLLTGSVVTLYDFRQLGLLANKHVLYVTQLTALVNTLLVLYGIKVCYVGPYG